MARRWGITLPLGGVPLPEHRELLAELVAAGCTDVWTAETNGADGFTPLALAAAWSPGVRLGTAVAPVYTRGPALLAMTAAAVAEAAPGRFVLGIGSSAPAIVERWNGGTLAEPYRRTRDTLRFLRQALAGERVDQDFGTFAVRGFRLDRPPATPPPIVLAALRPGMLRLAAREADGAITNWLAAGDVPRVRAELGDGVELLARIFVCPTEDAAAARALGRQLIAAYLSVPAYTAFHQWLGRGPVLAPMLEAWAAGDRKAATRAIPDTLVDDLVVHGTPQHCRDHVQRYVDAGLDTPIVMPLPTRADPREAALGLAPGTAASGASHP